MGSDDSVVNAARVSFDKVAENYTPEQNAKLINYLAKHKHYSPFNHTFLSFKVKAPIFTARQLVKHEYLPWNEVSRRYVDDEPEFWLPAIIHARAHSVKQGSGDVHEKSDDLLWQIQDHAKQSLKLYEQFLADGMSPEEARIILPHTLMTEWIWSGTLKAFHKMLSLRLDSHTQRETQIVAEKILELIHPIFPISIEALLDESK